MWQIYRLAFIDFYLISPTDAKSIYLYSSLSYVWNRIYWLLMKPWLIRIYNIIKNGIGYISS